uniref:Sushi domain-containing protein n=2 Tax=Parascaris univalens TaxID=6257 RepID=A0A915BRI8_PARUN
EWADALQANSEESSAVALAKGTGWQWMSVPQSVHNSWICQTRVGEFGTVIFSSQSYAVGSACYYSCEPGYKLVGSIRRNCLPTGRWSHSIPQCQPVDCGSLEEWSEGAIILLNRSTTFRSIAEYRCRHGTYMSKLSPTHRFCGSDSLWSTPVPFCSLVECGKPQNVTNGNVYCSSTTFNSTATYVCDPKFRLVGAHRIYCNESGRWHPAAPLCYDEEAIRAISDSSSVSITAVAITMLSVLVALAIAVRIVVHCCVSSSLSLESFVEHKCASPRPLVYAAPSQVNDSHIYYASTGAATTEIELPSQLVRVHHLPNGNVHVTLPNLRPMTRCPPHLSTRPEELNIEELEMRSTHPLSNSPTPSQLLYSFDDEPFYDLPPDDDSLYEEVRQTHANTGT